LKIEVTNKTKYGAGINTKDCCVSFIPSFAVYESFPRAGEWIETSGSAQSGKMK